MVLKLVSIPPSQRAFTSVSYTHLDVYKRQALDWAVREIQRIQEYARTSGDAARPRWPMIVFQMCIRDSFHLLAAFLCITGVGLVSLSGSLTITWGDLLSLGSALFLSLIHICPGGDARDAGQ